jgi:hypothetical protein
MSLKSPCIDVCRFDASTGWCEGCGRTRAEIAQWRKLTPFRRSGIERELPRRLARIGTPSAVQQQTPRSVGGKRAKEHRP